MCHYKRTFHSYIAEFSDTDDTSSDTVAATLSYLLYELCRNPKTQAKLRTAIDATEPNKAHLDVEDVTECAFLDGVINETLRLHPAVRNLWKRLSFTLLTRYRPLPVRSARRRLKASHYLMAHTYPVKSTSGCLSTACNATHATGRNRCPSCQSDGPANGPVPSSTSVPTYLFLLDHTTASARNWQ
jgi:hypothetical protein